jgi:hypothetical protein
MPRKKPKKLKITNPSVKAILGATVPIDFEGEYDVAVAGRKTGILAQFFSKAGGFPFQENIDMKVTHSGKKFSDSASWKPKRLGTHSVRLLAWDITNVPENGKDHASHLIRVRVTKD